MSKETAFESALTSIRLRTKDAIATAIQRCGAKFLAQSHALERAFAIDGSLTPARGRAMRASMTTLLNACAIAISTQTIDCIQSVVLLCRNEMEDAHQEASDDENIVIPDLTSRFDSLNDLAAGRIDIAFGRTIALPNLIAAYQADAVDAVTSLINAAIIHGLSELSVAGDIAALMLGSDIMYGDYGLSRTALSPLRAFGNYANRIVLSEGFNTMREATSQALDLGKFVQAAKWTLSPAHSIEDICDSIARADSEWGKGYYSLANWPNAPHARCACSPGGPLVFFPVAQWT